MRNAGPTAVSRATLTRIARRFGASLDREPARPVRGGSHTLYYLGKALVLRIPHAPRSAADLERERIASQTARAVGVRTPALIAVDDRCDLLPVPYSVYERVHGVPLEKDGWTIVTAAAAWRALGSELALLHTAVTRDGAAGQLPALGIDPDPRPWLDELLTDTLISVESAAWFTAWLARLAPFAPDDTFDRLCHGDMNAGNILVAPGTDTFLAIIDWDAAGWGDHVWDLVRVSLSVVPWILEGYRVVAPADPTMEARLVWHYLQSTVFGLRYRAPRRQAWVEQRCAGVRQELAAFLEQPTARWMA